MQSVKTPGNYTDFLAFLVVAVSLCFCLNLNQAEVKIKIIILSRKNYV